MHINKVKISKESPIIIMKNDSSKLALEFDIMDSYKKKVTYKNEEATEFRTVYSVKGNKDAVLDVSFFVNGYAVKNLKGKNADKKSLSVPDDILSEIPQDYLRYIASSLMNSEKVSVKVIADNMNEEYGICPTIAVFANSDIRDDIPEQFGAYEYNDNQYYTITI